MINSEFVTRVVHFECRLTLPEQPTAIGFADSGDPVQLARRTADWFGGLLRRPIVRQEWLRFGKVHAHRWAFADSGQSLVEGKVRTNELGQPDRVVKVRGDLQ